MQQLRTVRQAICHPATWQGNKDNMPTKQEGVKAINKTENTIIITWHTRAQHVCQKPHESENHVNVGPVSIWDVKEPLRTTSTLAVTILSDSCVSPRLSCLELTWELRTSRLQLKNKPKTQQKTNHITQFWDHNGNKCLHLYVSSFLCTLYWCLWISIQCFTFYIK